MTTRPELLKDPAIGVAVADIPEELAVIKRPDCPAAFWRRQPEPSFQSWIDTLAPEHFPSGRIVLRPEAVPDAMTQLCDNAGTPQCKSRAQLIDDISTLAEIFAELMDAQYLRLRLTPVTTNACRKFHIDAITARLICTYRGAGTQYGISTDGDDPKRVFSVPTGSPFVLRGTLWPEHPASGLLHRSPPIEGTDETRLVLVLDPIFDVEDRI